MMIAQLDYDRMTDKERDSRARAVIRALHNGGRVKLEFQTPLIRSSVTTVAGLRKNLNYIGLGAVQAVGGPEADPINVLQWFEAIDDGGWDGRSYDSYYDEEIPE